MSRVISAEIQMIIERSEASEQDRDKIRGRLDEALRSNQELAKRVQQLEAEGTKVAAEFRSLHEKVRDSMMSKIGVAIAGAGAGAIAGEAFRAILRLLSGGPLWAGYDGQWAYRKLKDANVQGLSEEY